MDIFVRGAMPRLERHQNIGVHGSNRR
jgi:hypothetical protein